MIKKILMVMVAVCCLVLPGFADSHVAMVSAVKGDVTKGGQPVKIMMSIDAGDKLHVGAGAQITLMFFGDQHKETISGDTTFAVDAKGTNAPANKKVVAEASGGLKAKGGSVAMLNSDQYGGVAKRSAGGETGLVATSPRHSLTSTPELRWTSVEGAANYVVSVQKDFGDAPIISETVTGTSVKLSQSLDRGKPYIWKVEAKTADGKELGEDISDIEVLSDRDATALKAARVDFESARKKTPDDVSPYLALAAKYMDAGLPNEAIGVFQELAAKNPTNAYPHERMQALYKSMGMEKEAKEQEAKAAELNK
jgi:hypothetical protein